jgi:proprotein convertase subtilisin/kexin type 5
MIFVASTGKCACNSGYFITTSNSQCYSCPLACTNCVNNKNNVGSCVTCNDPSMSLNSGKCVCQANTFLSISGQKCLPCDPSCQGCKNSGSDYSYCTSCADPRATYSSITGKCTCPSGMYFSSFSSLCINCDQRCATCIDSTNVCTTCANIQYIIRNSNQTCDCQSPYTFYQGTCVKSIPNPSNMFIVILIGILALAGIITLIVVLLICK